MKFTCAFTVFVCSQIVTNGLYAGGVEIEDIYLVALHTDIQTEEISTGESTEEYVQRILPLLKEATLKNRQKYEGGLYKGVEIGECDRVVNVWESIKGFSVRLTPDAAEKLKHLPDVKTVENDAIISSNGAAIQTSDPYQLDRLDEGPAVTEATAVPWLNAPND